MSPPTAIRLKCPNCCYRLVSTLVPQGQYPSISSTPSTPSGRLAKSHGTILCILLGIVLYCIGQFWGLYPLGQCGHILWVMAMSMARGHRWGLGCGVSGTRWKGSSLVGGCRGVVLGAAPGRVSFSVDGGRPLAFGV